MANTPPVLTSFPYVLPVAPSPGLNPQIVYGQAPPVASEPSFRKMAANGLAIGGRFYSVMGAVVGVIVMLIMVIIGVSRLHDKRTASALMTVTKVTACNQQTITDRNGYTSVNYLCSVLVKFTVGGNVYTSPQSVNVTVPAPLANGDAIKLRYDPNNPTDIVQEVNPRALGWGLIGGGVFFGALSVGVAVMTFKSKGFAEFEGAAGLLSSFGRRR